MSLDKRSIELGTEGWGVKEDNLLAFRKDRTRYVEKPFTFSRASEGTIINSDGYIQYSGVGDELITNGGFDTDSDWTDTGTGWSIANGKASHDSTSGSELLYQQFVTAGSELNKLYKLSFTISDYQSGDLRVVWGGYLTVDVVDENGNVTLYLKATNASTDGKLYFQSFSFIGSIDNVSLKEVEQETPRISYDIVNGVVSDKPHLLLEPARTNLCTHSEFTGGFSFSNTTISRYNSISPSGVRNATLLKGNTNSSRHYAFDSVTTSATAVFSLFVKSKELRYIQIASASTAFQYANFDARDGVVGTVGSAFNDVKIEDYGNGWYRCSAVASSPHGNFWISLVSGLDAPWLETWSMPNNTDGLYIWGAQLEEGTYLSSYIPTHGLIETRTAETANNCGAAQDFNSEKGAFFVETTHRGNGHISINDTTYNNGILVYLRESMSSLIQVRRGGTQVTSANDIFGGVAPIGEFKRIAFNYSSNSLKVFVNGYEVYDISADASFSDGLLKEISFDRGDGGFDFYGKCKELKYFPETLNDEELRLLTKYAPKDYDAAFTADYIDTYAEFTVLRTEATDKLYYVISDGTNEVSGNATITATEVTISNIDISSLNDGTLTLSVYIEDERKQRGVTVTDTTIKDTTNTPLYSYALQQRATGATFEDLDNSESIIESLNVEV